MTKVYPYGPERARIMLVGEAPGKDEEATGRPFVGTAGQKLREGLMAAGIDPESCYYTNICFVRPPNNQLRAFFDEDGLPTKNTFVVEALQRLVEDINRIKPHVIVALGNFPLWALTDKARWVKVKQKHGPDIKTYTGITDWRGSILECSLVPGCKVIPTFHPSYICREGFSDHGTWTVDLQRVQREAEFPEIRRPKKEIIIDPRGRQRFDIVDRIRTPRRSGRVADFLGTDNAVTLDIEYLLNAKEHTARLLCVGFTNSPDWCTTVHIQSATDLEWVRRILTNGTPVAAQNSMFDLSVLAWQYQMDLFGSLIYDTMLASHAANIELPKGLDYLVSIYTDQPNHKHMIDWNAVKAGKQPIRDVLEYNCIDVWTQDEIMEQQILWDFDNSTMGRAAERVFRFEMQLTPILWEMSRRGIRVNQEKREALSKQAWIEATAFNQLLEILTGREINVKSPQQVAKLLFEDLGLPVVKKTGKGAPATDDKTLAALVTKCETDLQRNVLNTIREIRTRRDLRSKFAEVEFDSDGRARGMYSPAGTTTGRLSSKKFYPTGLGLQQQNIPTNKKARSVFVADKGMLFGYADLERAESLVVAVITGDPEMLRVHKPGVDAHKELAAQLFNKAVEDITDDERYLGKRTRHAGNYMQGPKTFMDGVNQVSNKTGVSITFAEARHFINVYREVHPFLKVWWKETEAEVWSSRTLWNLLKRYRIFYGHISSILPEAVAFVPQSTVGDTLNVGLLNLSGVACEYMLELDLWNQYSEWQKELMEYGYQSLLQVHDAVGFQVRERDADRALPLIERLLTIPLTVPKTLEEFSIPVEVQVGPSWGEVEKLSKWFARRAAENGEEARQLA